MINVNINSDILESMIASAAHEKNVSWSEADEIAKKTIELIEKYGWKK